MEQLKDVGIREVLGAARVPQQREYIERVIGTIGVNG
jgi:transposase InsO family protein